MLYTTLFQLCYRVVNLIPTVVRCCNKKFQETKNGNCSEFFVGFVFENMQLLLKNAKLKNAKDTIFTNAGYYNGFQFPNQREKARVSQQELFMFHEKNAIKKQVFLLKSLSPFKLTLR